MPAICCNYGLRFEVNPAATVIVDCPRGVVGIFYVSQRAGALSRGFIQPWLLRDLKVQSKLLAAALGE